MAGRRRLAPDQRREQILRTARQVFSRQPYGQVSVADLAAAAGVSPPLIVFYFGSKSGLYVEVIRSAVTSIREGLHAVPGPPSLQRLHAGVRFYAEYAMTHRHGFLSLLRGRDGSPTEAAQLAEGLRAELTTQIVEDITAASPPAAAADPAQLIVAVRGYLGYVDAAVEHWLALPDPQRDQLAPDTLADLAVGAFTGALAALTSPPITPPTPPGTPDPADPPSF